ncbi:MAG TPA: hypothetical protein V6D21_21065 [Candidatus Obscuribacterales bacterium]
MRIELISWSSEGLRCPDMRISLLEGETPAHISLIQMPNGTAKTTTLTLIRAALTGEAEQWNSEEVISFRRAGESNSEGTFILNLKIDGKPLTFELNFDFEDNKVSYSTSFPLLEGINLGWKPPNNISRFLDKRLVRLFVFDGELSKDLLDPSKTEASRAIDAFFQLYLLEKVKKIAEDDWERETKNQAKSPKGLTQQRNRVKELQERISEVEKILNKRREKLLSIESEIDDLKSKIDNHESLDKALAEKVKEAEKEKIKTDDDVKFKVNQVINQIRQPQSLHESFSNSLIELKSKLDKAKLPEKASRQFFIDILEEKDCICGRELNDETRQEIQKRSELYLSDHTAAFLNGLKEDIRNILGSGDHKTVTTLNQNIQELQDDIEIRQLAETECRALNEKLIEQGNDEVKSWYELLEKSKEDKIKLEEDIKKITRSPHPNDNPKSPKTTWCLQSLKNWLEEDEEKLAEISGTLELRQKKNILQEIVDQAFKKASQNLRQSIIRDCNYRLRDILSRDPIEIAEIERSIKLKNQERGSEGQTLSVGYIFLTTLLSRGENKFPLVVDSPANAIDINVAREIGKRIPALCEQFIAFTTSRERAGFTDTLFQNSNDTKFFTVFRKTTGTEQLLKNLPKNGVTINTNCVVVEGKDYFDQFDLAEELEEN